VDLYRHFVIPSVITSVINSIFQDKEALFYLDKMPEKRKFSNYFIVINAALFIILIDPVQEYPLSQDLVCSVAMAGLFLEIQVCIVSLQQPHQVQYYVQVHI